MTNLNDRERRLAEVAAHVIAKAEEIDLPDPPHQLGVPTTACRLLARCYIELRDQVRALHDLVDQTDPSDPIGVALTQVGLVSRPVETVVASKLRLVYPPMTPVQIVALSTDELTAIYCRVMREVAGVFAKYETYVVRVWDGMDGCWTNCTGEVSRDEALRVWAEHTDGGTCRISYAEIDYYRIFSGDTRMHRDRLREVEQ